MDNLDAGIIGVSYFADKDLVNPVIISPDAGGVYRAKKFLEGYVMSLCIYCYCCDKSKPMGSFPGLPRGSWYELFKLLFLVCLWCSCANCCFSECAP